MPYTPDFPGMNGFLGVQIHSHDYRIPENFENMKTLIIGSGPSGVDICMDVAKVANQVNLSSCVCTVHFRKYFVPVKL